VTDNKEKNLTRQEEVKEVAALQYNPSENQSPKLVALGKGETAEKIIEKAKEHNIPIIKDKNLAHTLNQLNIGDEIPRELYEVVAEILVFVSNLDKNYAKVIK